MIASEQSIFPCGGRHDGTNAFTRVQILVSTTYTHGSLHTFSQKKEKKSPVMFTVEVKEAYTPVVAY